MLRMRLVTILLTTVLILVEGNEKNDEHQFLVMPKLGLGIEDMGQVFTYESLIYQKLVYIIDVAYEQIENQIGNKTECEPLYDLKEIIDTKINLLQSSIPPFEKITINRRIKRFAAALSIGGIVAGAFGIIKSEQVQKGLTETNAEVSGLQLSLKRLQNIVAGNSKTTNQNFEILSQKVTKLEGTVKCLATNSRDLIKINIILESHFRKTMAAYISAIDGKLTPDFISVARLKNLIANSRAYKGTIYETDPLWVYKIGHFIFASVSHDPFEMTGLLVIPKVYPKKLGTIISISTVPIFLADVYQPLVFDVPEIAIKQSETKSVFHINLQLCFSKDGYYFCEQRKLKKLINKCLTNIIFQGSSKDCPLKHLDDSTTHVAQLYTGLLVSPLITSYKILSSDDSTVNFTLHPQPQAHFIAATKIEPQEIIINSVRYSVGIEEVNVNEEIFIPDIKINQTALKLSLRAPLKLLAVDNDKIDSGVIVIYCGSFIIFCLISLLTFLSYKLWVQKSINTVNLEKASSNQYSLY